MSVPVAPAEVLAVARQCEAWRAAIELEVCLRPEAKADLDDCFSDLAVARELLAECAQRMERYLALRRVARTPHPPINPPEPRHVFAHLRG